MAKCAFGDIRQLSVAGREFLVAEEGGCKLSLGGFVNSAKAAGNGKAYPGATRKLASIGDLPVVCREDTSDLEYLQAWANAQEMRPVVITLASGIAYGGAMYNTTEEIAKDTKEGTVSLNLSGEKLEQI